MTETDPHSRDLLPELQNSLKHSDSLWQLTSHNSTRASVHNIHVLLLLVQTNRQNWVDSTWHSGQLGLDSPHTFGFIRYSLLSSILNDLRICYAVHCSLRILLKVVMLNDQSTCTSMLWLPHQWRPLMLPHREAVQPYQCSHSKPPHGGQWPHSMHAHLHALNHKSCRSSDPFDQLIKYIT